MQFGKFINEYRLYWMWPILISIVVFGALFALTEGATAVPFVYTRF